MQVIENVFYTVELNLFALNNICAYTFFSSANCVPSNVGLETKSQAEAGIIYIIKLTINFTITTHKHHL